MRAGVFLPSFSRMIGLLGTLGAWGRVAGSKHTVLASMPLLSGDHLKGSPDMVLLIMAELNFFALALLSFSTQSSNPSVWVMVKAIFLPSGETTGKVSFLSAVLLRLVGLLPSLFMIQISNCPCS